MITNTGKEILAKYLIGQAPSYASYIAIGCGPKPLSSLHFSVTNKKSTGSMAQLTIPGHNFTAGQAIYFKDVDKRFNGKHTVMSVDGDKVSIVYSGDTFNTTAVTPNGLAYYDYSSQTALDFEMFRVPITSKGFVNDGTSSKLVFTAELPTNERYEISEVGVYSGGSNPIAGAYDSRTLFAFTTEENWEYHSNTSSVAIPITYAPLDGANNDNIIAQDGKVFQTNSDNRLFTNQYRIGRYERARFFNNIVMMRGDTSNLQKDQDGRLTVGSGSDHIHFTGINLDFNKNSPIDEMKIAFSVINKHYSSSYVPEEVRILVEFSSSDIHNQGEWARFEVIATAEDHDLANNRYIVSSKQLQELYKSTGFTWNNVDVITIYASVFDGESSPSSDFYVGLDAIRFENIGSVSPVYGLTGYTVVKTQGAETIVKASNTTNFIEFRFAMDVL
jgi:hypothetical protein